MDEWSNERVATTALRKLDEMGPASLRDQEAVAPVGRETIRRWKKEDYRMSKATKRAVMEWLSAIPAAASPSYRDGVKYALQRVESTLAELREIASEADEPLTPEEVAVAEQHATGDERDPPGERPGSRGGDGRRRAGGA